MKKDNSEKNKKGVSSKIKGEDYSMENSEKRSSKMTLQDALNAELNAKNELKEESKKLQLIIDSMPAVIGYINTDFQFQFANKFLKVFLNVNPSNIIGEHIKNVVGEKAFEKVKHKYEAAFAGEKQEFEELIPLPNGQFKQIQATYIPHNINGKVVGTFILIHDISKRKQYEKELEEAKNELEKSNLELAKALEMGEVQFNLFADNLPGNVFIKNEKLEYIFLNQNALNVFSLNKKSIKGLTTQDLFTENVANKLQEVDKEVQLKKQIIENELKTNGGNKNEKWERFIKFPIKMPDGKIFVGGFALDITEEKQRIQEVENSELQYRSLFESARDGILIIDKDKIIDVNLSALKKFRYKNKSEIIDKSLFDISPEFQIDGSLSKDKGFKILEKAKAGEPQLFNWKHKRKDGTEFFTEVSLNQFTFNKNKYILASVRDISKRVTIENELKDSEQRFSQAFDNSPIPISILNFITGKRLAVNNAFCNNFGYSKKELLNEENIHKTNIAVDQEEYKSTVKKILKEGTVFEHPFSVYTKSGKIRLVLVNATPAYTNNKDVYLTSYLDVTERKKAELELVEAKENAEAGENYLNNILSNIADPVFVKDDKSRLLLVNDSFCELFKRTREEIIGKTLTEDVSLSEKENFLRIDKQVLKTGKGSVVEERLTIRGGQTRTISTSKTRYIDSNNKKHIIGVIRDITNRINDEKKLQESKTKFEILSNATFEGILIHDNGVPVDLNNSFPKMFGYTKDEFMDEDLVQLIIHKDYQNTVYDNVKIEHKLSYEVIGVKKDGTEFPIEIEGKTYITGKNKKLRVAAIRDLTERKKAEESLKEAFAQLNLAVETAKLGVWTHDIETGRLIWNSELFEMFGIAPSEFDYSVSTPIKFVHPEDLEYVMEQQEQVFQNKSVSGFDFRIIRPNNEVRNIFATVTPIFDEEGNLTKIIGINLDVTERKLSEINLKEAFAQLNLAVNTAKLGVWTHDIKTGELVWNNELFEIFGIDPSKFDYSADAFKKLVHPEDLEYVLEKHDKAGQNKTGDSLDFRIIRPNNEVRNIYATVTPVFDEKENVIKTIGINLDVTERKKAEEKLAQTNLELIDAVASLNELKKQLEHQNVYLKKELDLVFNFEEMIYGSDAFSEILTDLERVAPTNATVLLTGESGTGKELLARALHNLSLRKSKPLIKVNCSAIPSELIESELFGHKKGSFTGAVSDKLGKFELADGGTLFLDEIGDLPLAMQPKLLRFLQEGEMEVVGGTETRSLDVRIVAATNKDLKSEVNKSQFREDLYFRLNVFPIEIPALKDRKEDIPLLVEHFVDKFGKKYRKNIKYISDSAMQDMKVYSWPGNIRELENLVERSVILSDGEILSLPGFGLKDSKKSRITSGDNLTLNEVQKNHILSILEKTNWKVDGPDGAAIILDIKPSTFRDKMKKLGIKKPKQ